MNQKISTIMILLSGIFLSLFFLGCENKDSVSSENGNITKEAILGKWYSLFSDSVQGWKMVVYLDNKSDNTASVGILNGLNEVLLLEINYSVNDGKYVFIAPEVDFSNQNALQIMMADVMEALIYTDEIHLENGALHFKGNEEDVVFCRSIPTISGGTISGTISVTGKFGQGAVIISAYDSDTEMIGGVLLSQPGQYYIQGLADGHYDLMALYIPKGSALYWMDYELSEFPSDFLEEKITITDSNTVSGIDFNLDISSTTLETGTVTDIDGNVYQTVKIGNQWWMAENLKVTHYQNAEEIINITDDEEWTSFDTGAYCTYNNDELNVTTYGCLYNWYAANDNRNIAPSGWHVPSDEEWKELEIYLGMNPAAANITKEYRGTNEGGKIKEAGTAHWTSPNTGATNLSGFSALPGGVRSYYSGDFATMGNSASFWCSTADGRRGGWRRNLIHNYSSIYRDSNDEHFGFSVRCIKN